MKAVRTAAFAALCVFYGAYAAKALLLKRRGIRVNSLGKGQKPKAALRTEQALRAATALGVVVQLGSVAFPSLPGALPAVTLVSWAGVGLMAAGSLTFLAAIAAMRDNWRAGFHAKQTTSLVTTGVYRFSRNPAFVGFDLLYLGCALAFPNVFQIVIAGAALALFHLQILGEETHCAKAFGQSYAAYSAQVRRYWGRKFNKNIDMKRGKF
jgi:protein-S-isoprenylcysteine O-methyltransferase Ste14